MTQLTSLQFRLMDRIAHDLYCATNGDTPTEAHEVSCWLWADEFAKDLGLTGQQVGGLLTGLQEAGLIGMDKQPKRRGEPDESSVWFTEAGFTVWRAEWERAEQARDMAEGA